MNTRCCANYALFVNDLITVNIFFSNKEVINHCNIRLKFIEYFSILSVIPDIWKLLIGGIDKLDLIENDVVNRLKSDHE
jgi:hypothetical protein